MIRVLVVDDHEVVRWGIEQVLDPEPEIEVVATADDGSTALDLVARLPVDVVLMDLSMRGVGGVEATWRLREIAPCVRVVVLTAHGDDAHRAAAAHAGAAGYVLKSAPAADLISAIRSAAR